MADSKKAPDFGATISVVIPTFKRPNLALKAAQTIRAYHSDVKITIIDQQGGANINEDEIRKFNIKLVNLSVENTSVAKNRGIKESSGEIIFFFDDDIEITKDTIPYQLKEYDDPLIVGTCGRVLNDHETIPANTDVSTGKMNWIGTEFLQQFWSTRKQEIDFPYGCNMSFRASVLKKVNGFDERFPKIFEEIDLGKRVGKYGKLFFVPKGLAYHHKAKSGGTRTDMIHKMRMIYRYYGLYIAKHVMFPLSIVTLILRTRTVLREAPYALKDLISGYFSHYLTR